MIYLKSLGFGIVAAVAASVIWILVTSVFPLHIWVMLESVPGWMVSGTLAVALFGFILGFYWGVRKSQRASRSIFR
jgi:protein-S-isoprenylcysteine O-methyltransferase Ste14